MECTNEEEVFGDYMIEKFLEPCPVEKNQIQLGCNKLWLFNALL